MDIDTVSALCRFLHDGAAMLLWGALAFLAGIAPRPLGLDLARRLRGWLRGGILVAAATTAAQLPLAAAMIGGGWPDALRPAILGLVLTSTSIGTAWMVQAATVVALGATLRRADLGRPTMAAVAAALFLAGLAFTGHAAMQEGWLGLGHRANDVLHLLAAGFWVGALVPVTYTLRDLDDVALRGQATRSLMRFSFAGHIAVALAIASGVINIALILGRWPTDWASPYQALLAAKIVLVGIMIAVALANRYVFVPRLRVHPFAAHRALRRATLVELLLGCGVIALVAVFGQLEPS